MALILAERDPVFFVNEFCWTFDPREAISTIPFELFEKQEEALRWMQDMVDRGRVGIMEKSRDAGATWLAAAFAVWLWLFRPGSAVGFGSRKLELVDRLGDPKCIFDKIRTIINNLPPWLMQARAGGYNRKTHDNWCKIINPANGSTITGEGGTEIGRGDRTTVYFIDEAAFLDSPEEVDRALSATSRSRIYISTPHGSANTFAVKRLSGKFPVFTVHWKDDPRKTAWVIVREDWEATITMEDGEEGELLIADEDILDYGLGTTPPPELIPDGYRLIYPWYEEKVALEDPVTVAQEIDIDYSASLEGVIIPAKWLRACVGLQLRESAVGDAGWDVASGGKAEHVYLHRKGPVVKRYVRWREEDPTTAAFRAVRLAEADRARRLYYDVVGAGQGIGGAIRLIKRKLCFAWAGINVGNNPTKNTRWPDRLTSEEKFENLKAETYWRLRTRAEKSYQRVAFGIMHPDEECLSLPPGQDTEDCITQLSNLKYFDTSAGKIIIESKDQLAERGVKSPDLAEALMLSFTPIALTTTRRSRSGGKAPTATPGGGTMHSSGPPKVVLRRRKKYG